MLHPCQTQARSFSRILPSSHTTYTFYCVANKVANLLFLRWSQRNALPSQRAMARDVWWYREGPWSRNCLAKGVDSVDSVLSETSQCLGHHGEALNSGLLASWEVGGRACTVPPVIPQVAPWLAKRFSIIENGSLTDKGRSDMLQNLAVLVYQSRRTHIYLRKNPSPSCLFGMGGAREVRALIPGPLVFVQFYLEHIASIADSGLSNLINRRPTTYCM